MIRERRRKNGVINVSEDRGGGTSDEEIKGVTIGVSRERDKLSEIKGMKKREKRSRFRARRVIKVKVEVTSDVELRRRRNQVFKEQKKSVKKDEKELEPAVGERDQSPVIFVTIKKVDNYEPPTLSLSLSL